MLQSILKFWPVWVPLFVYLSWYAGACLRAGRTGAQIPTLKDGPWPVTLVVTLVIVIVMFIYLGMETESEKGRYVPARLQDGELVPGYVAPNDEPDS